MSSSAFIETIGNKSDGYDDFETVDTDLVVVYQKNNINLDHNVLENLIVEKQLSSISVVRIVSPTPSMVEENSAIDINRKDIESDSNSDISTARAVAEDENSSKSHSENEDASDDESISKEQFVCSTNINMKDSSKTQKDLRRKTLIKPKGRNHYKAKTEFLGLSIEAFLAPDQAKEISKEALKQAGLSPFKKSSIHDFQLYVINNDHCYTPLSSPTQLKQNRHIDNGEGKNIFARNLQPNCVSKELKLNVNKELITVSEVNQIENKILPSKLCSRSMIYNFQNTDLEEQDCKKLVANIDKTTQYPVDKKLSINVGHKHKLLSSFSDMVPTSINSTKPQTLLIDQNNVSQMQQNIIKSTLQGAPIVQLDVSVKNTKSQTMRNVIIDKVTKSCGGKFTDITTLLTDSQKTENATVQLQTQKSSKGFLPLIGGFDTKISLPSQISIETHQSSSEIAAEQDKQLDLIDSIVQDEMQKYGIIEQTKSLDENIPKLVKMLENTENILGTSTFCDPLNCTTATQIDNQESRQMELNGTETQLPEDLLQHVVELIEDSSTLREAVEQQALQIKKNDLKSICAEQSSPLNTLFVSSTKQVETSSEVLGDNKATSEKLPELDTSTTNMMSICAFIPLSSEQDQSKHTTKISINNATEQIIRGNGRIMTLPRIEAPTTRAKRRTQKSPTRANTSLLTPANSLERRTLPEPKIEVLKDTISKENNDTSIKKITNKSSSNVITEKHAPRIELQKDTDDDDDPNKLWCICRQPHNNRFMICCDRCEDWFHGTCVNVPKAIGLEMEHKGIDWTCPNCIRKREEKNQSKRTDMIPSKRNFVTSNLSAKADTVCSIVKNKRKDITHSSTKIENCSTVSHTVKNEIQTVDLSEAKEHSSYAISERQTEIQDKTSILNPRKNIAKTLVQSMEIKERVTIKCIVCKKFAREHSIYCSDDCIRKHVHYSINAFYAKSTNNNSITQSKYPFNEKKKRSKELFEDVLSMADKKQKAEKVHVLERESGKIISGSNAPNTTNIKKWLQDNPTFEIIKPENSKFIKNEQLQLIPSNHRNNTVCSTSICKDPSLLSHQRTDVPSNVRDQQEVLRKFDDSSKQELKYDHKIKDKDRIFKRKTFETLINKQNENSTSSYDPEPIRLNVRSTLKEQLKLRMKELPSPKLTEKEIEDFALKTELEMYHYFNRDIGSKYKAKYRSLIFNIKDRKNHSLFTKICEKLIEPKQLIKMSPEELASQELARWREKEAKHQLEMITKSELDLLTCSKTFVLKTHKGEEEIENKAKELKVNINLDDIVTTLTDSDTSKEIKKDLSLLELPIYKIADLKSNFNLEQQDVINTSIEKKKVTPQKYENREKDNNAYHNKHSGSKHRHKDKYIKKSHHSFSRSRSVSREKRHESSHKESPHKVGRNNLKDSTVIHKSDIRSNSKNTHINSRLRSSINKRKSDKEKKKSEEIESFNLIDQILSSSKSVEEAANILPDRNLDVSRVSQKTNDYLRNFESFECSEMHNYFTEYNEKHNKRVLWTGNINMVDVTSFKVCLHSVACDDNNLKRDLYKELDVVGRIEHYTVWDYIYKIKKSSHKDVVIIILTPLTESEFTAYTILYDYLDKRKRLAVVDTPKKSRVKDFYIYPFASKSKLPEILHPLEPVEIFKDTTRPNLLIGILIRTLGARSFIEIQHQSKLAPSSPKKRKRDSDDIDIDAIIKAPIASKLQKVNLKYEKNEVDDPYSPGGSIDDDISLLPVKSHSNTHNEALKREMDEINRKIARQEMEIAGLLKVDPTVKCFAPNASNSSMLSKISIPSNLSQILASIKSKPDSFPSAEKTVTSVLSSVPINNAFFNPSEKNEEKDFSIDSSKNWDENEPKYSSRLAQLTEAELLRMVPDDMIESRCEEPPPPGV